MAGAFTRLAGLFKTKRAGMLVGTCKGEDLDNMIKLIKEAKSQNVGLTFFLFSNPPKGDRGPVAGLSAAVERPREAGSGFQGRPKAKPTSDPLAGLFGEDASAPTAGAAKAELDW